ncbi:hypothetical protein [Candidatus Protofrankia datiscae]|uniref:hypothetical protein n=1 Tax=Candidatus Protofrankia datiscae TaxID=2716812 RepID=UPI0013ECD460|nr:hypothetical protein [Candidatus Protofrankia datiscae]
MPDRGRAATMSGRAAQPGGTRRLDGTHRAPGRNARKTVVSELGPRVSTIMVRTPAA